jgi:uncharacterized protein YdhG (YjbR/CyaY superfamily)
MKAGSRIPRSVDEYIARFPPEVRGKLEKLRDTIHDAASGISERISYQMPAFERQGILVWFAAFAKHIGFFPTAEGVAAFKKRLGAFAASKGTIQFPLDAEPPYALVKEIVKHRVRTNAEKAAKRSTGSRAKKPTATKKAATRSATPKSASRGTAANSASRSTAAKSASRAAAATKPSRTTSTTSAPRRTRKKAPTRR